MKSVGGATLLLAWVALAPAGEETPTHADVVKKMLGTLDAITKTLGTVVDQGTADAAKSELGKAAKDWVTLRTTAEKLAPPSREEKERLEKEYKPKLEAAQIKLAAEVARVRNVAGGLEALQEIRGVLSKPKKKN